MANKAFKMRKKSMAASLQRKIKEQMSKKTQASPLAMCQLPCPLLERAGGR